MFFSNGVHHHYAEDKFFPDCPKDYFKSLMSAVGSADQELLDFVYDTKAYPQRRSTSKEGDIVSLSAVNFYENVNRKEVEDYYASIMKPNDAEPVSYGLNSKLVKDASGKIREEFWKVGGIYGPALKKISDELKKAAVVAENPIQEKALKLN